MESMVLYIHGQGGNAQEAEHYRPLFPGRSVIGLPYTARTPWEAVEEFPRLLDALNPDHVPVTLIANSIGAYFAMCALENEPIDRAFFISPVADMQALIENMMVWAGVTEEELQAKGEIPTDFGQTLSWDYLTYTRTHPIRWRVPTHILCGSTDHLTSPAAMTAFARRIGASLTVMEQGEHWFHTPEQMQFLDGWLSSLL